MLVCLKEVLPHWPKPSATHDPFKIYAASGNSARSKLEFVDQWAVECEEFRFPSYEGVFVSTVGWFWSQPAPAGRMPKMALVTTQSNKSSPGTLPIRAGLLPVFVAGDAAFAGAVGVEALRMSTRGSRKRRN